MSPRLAIQHAQGFSNQIIHTWVAQCQCGGLQNCLPGFDSSARCHRGVAELIDARASGARGLRPCGFESSRPDQTLNQAIRTGGLVHAEKRPARDKTMPHTGQKWREHGPGDHARRDRADRTCTGRRHRPGPRLQGALRERAEGIAKRPSQPRAASTSPRCLPACFCCQRALKQAALNQLFASQGVDPLLRNCVHAVCCAGEGACDGCGGVGVVA